MICYRCGSDAGKKNTCPHCGADISAFQKAYRISNMYYNDGLEKARVRNLSGAIASLQKSLKFNKYNIDARNLLGLVYYEIGETVKGLSEWVISVNYQSEDNVANKYLKDVYKNRSHLSEIGQTIKKYNKAVYYCSQGSRDLAIIQLKKVISLNTKFVKAHQLLALLYLQDNQYEKAKKELRHVAKIDADNTLTRKYLREVDLALKASNANKKKKDDGLISYQSGNETIIMPKRFRETSLLATVGYLVLGLLIGAAATMFLVVPSVKNKAVSDAKDKLLVASDTISTNGQTITDLERTIDELQKELDEAKKEKASSEQEMKSYEDLISAYKVGITEDELAIGEALDKIDVSYLSESAKANYDWLRASIRDEYLKQLYVKGCQAHNNSRWEETIKVLSKVAEIDMDYEDGIAVYYLAQAYRKSNNIESARPYYKYVVERFPDSNLAKTAINYVNGD